MFRDPQSASPAARTGRDGTVQINVHPDAVRQCNMSGCSSSCLRVQAPHRTGSIPGSTLPVTLQAAALHSRQPRILERGCVSLSFAARGEVTSSCSWWWPRLCCAGCVHTPPVGPISKRGFLHFATQRKLYSRPARFGSALMMLLESSRSASWTMGNPLCCKL